MKELPDYVEERPVSLRSRIIFLTGFVLVIGVMVTFTPEVAKKIAYSWNIGVERARAEIARQFLADHPLGEQRIVFVARAAAPSVVGVIKARTTDGSPFMRRTLTIGDLGSGVIVDAEKGYILTNHHVIENAEMIIVQMSDGRDFVAEVIGSDSEVDLAVLRIEADDLIALPWGDSRQVSVGEQVVAIGSPYGFQQTVTAGIISATERLSTLPVSQTQGRRGRPSPQVFLQTDAAINPGNSGGPLVDMNGKLIGICTKIIAREGGSSGIGFAISSFTARRVFEDLILHGEVRHGWLGVELAPVTQFEARRMNQSRPRGAVVMDFASSNSPAREAGLRRGDIILRWEDIEIENPQHLTHLVVLATPGTVVTVEVFRRGELLTQEITIGTRPRDL